MTTLPRLLIVLALAPGLSAAQATSQATATPPPAAKPADAKPPVTQTPTTPTTRPGSIDLTVTNQTGRLLADATVHAEGPSSRQGTTSGEGQIILTNVTAGTYRVRIERDGYITLEKELVVKAATRTTAEAALSSAPAPAAPPPPPAPAPAPVAPTLIAGSPVTVSLVDQIADELIKSKDPIAEHPIGCSGASASKLLRIKDALPSHTHADADEMLYVIAGDATLTLAGKDQPISAGWYSLVPRGSAHAIKVKGGKPFLVLSIQSGPACVTNGAPVAK
jgi:mannose-6-phosphate isomerase-like protein (cupin superfamily)